MGVAVTYIQYSLVELQGWIAQWLEHLVYVQKVLGSIPGLVTFLYFNRLWALARCLDILGYTGSARLG